jgi:hypothetical protein
MRWASLLHAVFQLLQAALALGFEPLALGNVLGGAVPRHAAVLLRTRHGVEQDVPDPPCPVEPAKSLVQAHPVRLALGQRRFVGLPVLDVKTAAERRRVGQQFVRRQPQHVAGALADIGEAGLAVRVAQHLVEHFRHVVRHAEKTMLRGNARKRGIEQARHGEIDIEHLLGQGRISAMPQQHHGRGAAALGQRQEGD